MGKRARLQRLPGFRAPPPPGPLAPRPARPPAAPAPHQRGGWRHDADDEALDRDPDLDRPYDHDCPEVDEEPTGHELAPCGPIERLVHDWTHWSRALEPRWPFRLAEALPSGALSELRRRVAPGTSLPCPEVAAFARQHGCDLDAPATTLPGLALRALRRREGHALAPIADWAPLLDALGAVLAAAPGATRGDEASGPGAGDEASGPGARVSDEVVVLAFHEAVGQAPAALVRRLARGEWHEGWHPLGPWLIAGDEPGEVLERTQGSWLALRQMREAQREPPPRPILTHRMRDGWWEGYEERIQRLLRRGGASLRAPGYPSFVLSRFDPDPDEAPRPATDIEAHRHALTCRPLDPRTIAREEALAPGHPSPENMLQALAPQHVRYGLFDERGRRLPGYLSVFEAWSVAGDEPPEPTLCVEAIHDPGGLLTGVRADVFALLEGVARSRGLTAPLALLLSLGWGPPPHPLAREHRVERGSPARVAAADPVVWKLYNDATHCAWYRLYRAFRGGAGGRFQRPDPDDPWPGRAVRLAPLDPERDPVRAANLEEAFRLASSATGTVRATCRDQDGQMVGFTTG